jgi:hypothetical protein
MSNRADFSEDRFSVYENNVKTSFSFLIEDYGFVLSSIERADNNSITLKYFSEKVFVIFYYGSPGFELDFCVGRISIEDQPDTYGFNSYDLLCLSNDSRWFDYKLYSAHSYENLITCIPKLADLLKVLGSNCLKGDSFYFEKVFFDKKRRISQWGKEQTLKQARNAASEAWKNKDYKKFIKVFKPITEYLSVSERNKIEYARKQL